MTRRTANLLTLFLTLFSATFIGCAPKDPTLDNPEVAVVRIDARTPGHKDSAQSRGFFVSADGFIVTSLHPIDGAQDITITRNNGDRLFADLVQADKDADLAILRVHARGLPFLRLFTDDVEPGLHVRLIGVGGATHGVFDHWENLGNDLEFTIPMQGTDPGSPLLNDDNRVVGVARAPLKDNPSQSVATPIFRLLKMMPALRINRGSLNEPYNPS